MILTPAARGCTYNFMKELRFELRTDDAWMKVVDDWRAKQPGVPSRAEAIRRLVLLAAKPKKERAHG